MRIDELILQNFHRFENKQLEFKGNFTAIIGDNGVGKTAVLDGIAVALGAYISGLKGVKSIGIKNNEIFEKVYLVGQEYDFQRQYPCQVIASGKIQDHKIQWSRGIIGEGGRTTIKNAKKISNIALELQNKAMHGEFVLFPTVAYYGTGRLWNNINTNFKKNRNRVLEGYDNCLIPVSNATHFFYWFKQKTIESLQFGESPVLKAVKEAIKICMDNWNEIIFDLKKDDIVVTNISKETVLFSNLSDGIRNMIGMIADLAHRMAILNPSLGADVLKKSEGVVLIDEIDLHLHPSWQRRIVSDLKRTFPKVQFIVTTHSPFIIQSLKEQELIKLKMNEDNSLVSSERYVDQSIEEISQNVMEIEGVQRSRAYLDMYNNAIEYYELLESDLKTQNEKEHKNNQLKLNELELLYDDNPAYSALLKMERLSKKYIEKGE